MRTLRYLKYAYGAPLISFLVRNTSLFDRVEAPPDVINFAGGGNFTQIGDDLVTSIRKRAQLQISDRVLDVGGGIGRVAIALEKVFPNLDYLGLDVVRFGIEWSRKRFGQSSTYRFQHADIANSFYNPRGQISADNYDFPLESSSRDLIISTSVFTHLPEAATRRYVSEMGRVLSASGRVYLTTFLTDRCCDGAWFSFAFNGGCARLESCEEPDLAVAYSLDFWTEVGAKAGLRLSGVFPGTWSEKSINDAIIGPEFQDTLVFVRL